MKQRLEQLKGTLSAVHITMSEDIKPLNNDNGEFRSLPLYKIEK